MLSNLLYAIAVICAVLCVLALLGVIGLPWPTLLVVAIICAVLAYFLSGRPSRPL